MIRVVKHEWHQVDSQYEMILERDMMNEIYPDLSNEERDEIWKQIADGEYDYEQLLEDAAESKFWSLDWDHHYDDWWTHRKGGYDVTYEVEDDYEPPKTDQDRINDLHKEVNELCKQLGIEERYDTRSGADRLKALFDATKHEEL